MHAARNDASQGCLSGICGLAQFRQLRTEFVEQSGEAARCSVIGGAHIRLAPARLQDQINRTVLQMQPLAVSEKRDLRTTVHARCPGICGIGRTSEMSFSDDSGRT